MVEFLDGEVVLYDNVIGVLTNSPTYDWHLTNLRNYIGLTSVEAKPVDLMGVPVVRTGNGTGLIGMPGDVTPPSGDYTQWYVARDHDDPTYYVRSYDGWTTQVHRLADLGLETPSAPRSLPIPAA